jgi:hypothetical protein
MNRFVVPSVTLCLVLGIACKRGSPDDCERFLPVPSAFTRNAAFMTNVEPRSFLGIAVDSVTKDRLVGVSFSFEDLRIGAYTDSLGVALFRGLPVGWHRIGIRRLGYAQRRDSIQVSPLSGTIAVYELPRRRVETCNVVITS